MRAILLFLVLAVSAPTLAQDKLSSEDKALIEKMLKNVETLTPEEKAQRARDTLAKLKHHQNLVDTKQIVSYQREQEFLELGKDRDYGAQVAFLHKLEEEGYAIEEVERLRSIAIANVPRLRGKAGPLMSFFNRMTLKEEKPSPKYFIGFLFLLVFLSWLSYKIYSLDHGRSE